MPDFRSDTVTEPTPAMRLAMSQAAVGDDVYGDDATVQTLEQAAATKLGKAAALFVPTGTFGNQLAIATHCQRGDELIADEGSHIVWHEAGASAYIAGVQLRAIASSDGAPSADDIARRIRHGQDIHEPKTGLICLENAHSNGRVIPLAQMQEIWALAQAEGIPLHIDGARIFNAATHLGVPVTALTQYCDTVMCCLSKGLAAPIGSILAGPSEFIARARRLRKLLGGGWRQAGVLAAPGLIALNEMSARLEEDHRRAQALAVALQGIDGIEIDPAQVDINLVWFRITRPLDVAALMQALAAQGIKANPPEHGLMRLATHWQISDADIAAVVAVLRAQLAAAN
ncbi:low-specificity L-threonine aldolase [Chitinibacter tainanensis]|uniref:low-specificity L-threonine aldolase n=1 Tax=Chitinibacter tainanensis TaxID=230667 RepID=UPI002352E707|nr:low-specificity L-threonine aldolase [Chitinibacter tainanensis]